MCPIFGYKQMFSPSFFELISCVFFFLFQFLPFFESQKKILLLEFKRKPSSRWEGKREEKRLTETERQIWKCNEWLCGAESAAESWNQTSQKNHQRDRGEEGVCVEVIGCLSFWQHARWTFHQRVCRRAGGYSYRGREGGSQTGIKGFAAMNVILINPSWILRFSLRGEEWQKATMNRKKIKITETDEIMATKGDYWRASRMAEKKQSQ